MSLMLSGGKVRLVLGVVVFLGLLFQTGHFFEHATQWAMWVFGDNRSEPWMSAPAMGLVHIVGEWFSGDGKRQMMMGMEVLHLIGNGIFLGTMACLYFFMRSMRHGTHERALRYERAMVRNSTLVRSAFFVELFHLYEHIILTSSALFLKMPVGLSTLFGGAVAVFGSQDGAVGYRVFWHFAMNLIPAGMVMIALMRWWAASKVAQADAMPTVRPWQTSTT